MRLSLRPRSGSIRCVTASGANGTNVVLSGGSSGRAPSNGAFERLVRFTEVGVSAVSPTLVSHVAQPASACSVCACPFAVRFTELGMSDFATTTVINLRFRRINPASFQLSSLRRVRRSGHPQTRARWEAGAVMRPRSRSQASACSSLNCCVASAKTLSALVSDVDVAAA